MEVALTNLAANAVRHTRRGTHVTLRARATEDVFRFEVDDAGPGVAEAERDRIFEPFVRGDDGAGRGAGLGLYIAREVARAHGGRIGVEAADEGGARFWIEVPR
jgi:two-component system sensor histidine kinase GlrK